VSGFSESSRRSTSPAFLLELMHPQGLCESVAAGEIVDYGTGPYDWMTPLAPPAGQYDGSWLRQAMRRAAGSLEGDGLAWFTPPRRLRSRVFTEAKSAGLEVKGIYSQFEDAQGLKTLVPLQLMSSVEVANLSGRHVRLRQVAARALKMPGALRLVRAIYPSVGFAVGRPGGRPLFDWLIPQGMVSRNRRSVLLRRSWNRRDFAIAYVFGGDPPELAAVAKIPMSPDAESSLLKQEERLRCVASAAAGWGVETPRLVDPQPLARPALVTQALRGSPAGGVLERRSSELRPLLQRLARWLAGWNHSTRVSAPSGSISRTIATAAGVLEHHIPNGREYFAWLIGTLPQQAAGIPYVATHGDLTMWNVVMDGDGLGILDWEESCASDLPLGDLFYSVADAVAATSGYRDRVAAFHSCFFGSERQIAVPLVEVLAQELGLSAPAIETCFHLCWLRHAGNEVSRNPAGAPGPFLQIVRQLAAGPLPTALITRSSNSGLAPKAFL
jgi:hypothetical protein